MTINSKESDEERAITAAHEILGHVKRLLDYKPAGHDAGGQVDQHIKEIEERTKEQIERNTL